MFEFVKRNVKYYVRDRVSFALSLLSVGILLAVYKLFLSGFQLEAIKKASGSDFFSDSAVDMSNMWLVCGLVIIATVSTTIGALGVVVDDFETGRAVDFSIIPISKRKITLSYAISSVFVSIIISFLLFVLAVSIFVKYDALLHIKMQSILLVIIVLLLSCIMSVIAFLPIIKLLRTRSAYGTFSTIVGTVTGFLTGAYIAIGDLSGVIANIVGAIPFTQFSSILKKELMGQYIDATFSGSDSSVANAYIYNYGVELKIGNIDISTSFILFEFLSILATYILVSIFINWRRESKGKSKRK